MGSASPSTLTPAPSSAVRAAAASATSRWMIARPSLVTAHTPSMLIPPFPRAGGRRLSAVAQLARTVLARDVDDHGLALALDRDPRALERGPSGARVLDEQVDVPVSATPETRDALDVHPGRPERLRGLREPTRLVGQRDRQIGRHPYPPFDARERSYPGGTAASSR